MTTKTISFAKKINNSQRSYRRRKVVNYFSLSIMALLTLIALIPLFWIVSYVFLRGGQYINPQFFTNMPRPLGMEGGGVLHSIEGTLLLILVGSFFAVPPGLLAAFYVAYHPNTPLGILVRFGTDVLSGIPSIVVGLFCYALIVKNQGHYSALAGGIALAIIMLPTIIRTTEEMIKLTPSNLRAGSLALGAPEWKTALSITLPAAANGIITGVLLGIARAMGETAPLLFTALGNENFEIGKIAASALANKQSIFTVLGRIFEQPVDSLPLTLWKYAQQPFPERINQAWAAGLVLMLLVFIINITARVWIISRTNNLRG